ncbi:MAG: hypothetical protein OEZ58_13845 [Gammaproteobacteria bacterium]|nr:hypothetical protein [Gammaproteobacteria bacterium]MDH5730072.1 hypothetical protein [Gammaproteobacteria bacterium]
MEMVKTSFKKLPFIFFILILAACSGKTVVESDLGIKGAPDWVNEGTNILNDKGGRLFHGVGSAPPMGDDSLQKSAADNRARAELARILSSYMEVASKDYLASASANGDMSVESAVSRSIENATKLNLTGSRIIGRWKNKKNGVIFSIAEIDMKRVKETIANTDSMHPGFQSHFADNGDSLFDKTAKGGI